MRKEEAQKRVFLSWLETLKAAAIMFHPPLSGRSHTSPKKIWVAFAAAINDSKRWRVCISTSFGDLRKRKISLSLGTKIFSLFFMFNKRWSVPEGTTPCDNDNQEDFNQRRRRRQMKGLRSQEENWGCAKASPRRPTPPPGSCVVRWELSGT